MSPRRVSSLARSPSPAASPPSANTVALPPEIWALIIANIQDRCFAWCVLRRVSPALRSITEDAFALDVLRTCSVRLVGHDVAPLAAWHFPSIPFTRVRTVRGVRYAPWDSLDLTFKPAAFIASGKDAKGRLVFGHGSTTDEKFTASMATATWKTETVTQPVVYRHRKRCALKAPPDRIDFAEVVDPSTRKLSLQSGCGCINLRRTRAFLLETLNSVSHIVTINNQLRTIPIPSLALHESAPLVSLDWRLLCQTFYLDELRCRRALKPWLRDLANCKRMGQDDEQFLSDIRQDGWLFWD